MDVVHKGRDNVYVFPWKGKKIVLVSSMLELVQSNIPTLLVVQEADFGQQVKKQKEVVLLMSKPAKEDSVDIPEMIKPLLKQFADICPADLPNSLPSLRDIQHQIDLDPAASLPHLSRYRMSPREHEILQGIVDD